MDLTMFALAVTEQTDVAQARRVAVAAAESSGFGDTPRARVALAATELASNLLKHAGGGRLLVGSDTDHVELLSLDLGPGMQDVTRCLADGYSSAGTLGHGLGTLLRAAARLEIASWPGLGSVVFARIGRTTQEVQKPPDEPVAALGVALAGESVSGDACDWHEDGRGRTLFMIDGLGHGSEAARAAIEALRHFRRNRDATPVEIVQAVHLGLRATRGGAVAVARLDWGSGCVSFAGLGNIGAQAVPPQGGARRMVSMNGTAGHNARKVQAFDYPCPGGVVVLHSDGIGSNWSLDRYPGLATAHPALVAGTLYRDNARARDDATVLVSRMEPGP
jgi:anti-sigma regulatory factor (Ser/Thr protein kinase)